MAFSIIAFASMIAFALTPILGPSISLVAVLMAVLIGLSLGIMGGGGSILTVPVLVYLLNYDAKTSVALSLAIVGITALIGSLNHYRKGNVDVSAILIFTPFASVGTFFGAKVSVYLNGATQLLLFAIIMLLASYFMIKDKKEVQVNSESFLTKNKKMLIPLQGLVVGIITGLVGVGGGFMIVPSLVLLVGIPMKIAVGSSLVIIAINSLFGFIGYINLIDVPWIFLIKFSTVTILGVLIGGKFIHRINQRTLKKSFGYFLIVMGFLILYKNKGVFLAFSN